MKTLTNERFNDKDLVGLDRLYEEIEYVYQDQHVTKAVYEQKLFVLSACRDLAAAQRMLDFEIALAEHFSATLYFARDHEIENTVLVQTLGRDIKRREIS